MKTPSSWGVGFTYQDSTAHWLFGADYERTDWGSYRFVRPLKGVFGIIDEMEEVHAPEASVTGICLAPSVEGLLWILHAVGFARAELLPVPDDGYEQLKYGKRVMVAAYVD